MIAFLIDVAPSGRGSELLVIIAVVVIVIAVALVMAVATGIFVFLRVRKSRAALRATGERWAGTESISLSESRSNSPNP
jgi:hypothetical protein